MRMPSNPNSNDNEGECDQDQEDSQSQSQSDAVAPAPAVSDVPPSTAVATTTNRWSNLLDDNAIDNGIGMLQLQSLAMLTPPVPDSQLIAALEEEMSDEDSARKKERGKLDMIEDEPAPLPIGAMAASMNYEDASIKGKTKKGPKTIEGDVTASADCNDCDGPGIQRHQHAHQQPYAVAVPPNQYGGNNQDMQPQSNATTVPSSHQSQLDMSAPPARMNQDGLNAQEPSSTSAQDQPSARPSVGPISQTVLPGPSDANDTQVLPVPTLHEVEAFPVVDPPVYDATVVRVNVDPDIEEGQNNNVVTSQAEEEAPWWKKHTYTIFGIVFVLSVSVTAMGTLLATQGRNEGGANPTKSPTMLLDPSPNEDQLDNSLILLDSNSSTTVAELFNHPTNISNSSAMPVDSNNTVEDHSVGVPPTLNPTSANAPTVKPTTSAKLNSIVSSQAKLFPNDTQAGDRFGYAVSVSRDIVAIGAREDDDHGNDSGSVYLYIKDGDTWKQQAKLLPNDGHAGDRFGSAVALSGDTVVVGAPLDDDNGANSGSVYVFFRDGDAWKQQAKLLPPDGEEEDRFGRKVSLSGDTIIIGANEDDDNGNTSGSAYVFIRDMDKWKQQAKLLPNDGQAGDNFGIALAVSGDTAVIASNGDDDNGSYSGSAYVFVREEGTWKQQAKLSPNDGQREDRFGGAVAVSGSTIVVGANGDDDNGSDSGSAFVFIRDGGIWKQQAKLLPTDGHANDYFGKGDVSVSGDTVVVGANGDDDNGDKSGSAYVFMRDGDTWIQQAKILPNDGQAGAQFGAAVSVSGDTVVAGGAKDRNHSGSAYVFLLK